LKKNKLRTETSQETLGVDKNMGKWIDAFLGTSEERKKKLRIHEHRKNALQEQKENNKKMRTLYREKNREEIRLRQIRNKENKDKN
jgi:hypothetical protein